MSSKQVRRTITVPDLPNIWKDYIPERFGQPTKGEYILLSSGAVIQVTDAEGWDSIMTLIVRPKKHLLKQLNN